MREITKALLPADYSFGEGYEEAGVYGKDDRKKVDRLAWPYRTIGRLFTQLELVDKNGKVIGGGNSDCTATLVGNCHLLTARHCIRFDGSDLMPKDAPKGARLRVQGAYFVDARGVHTKIIKNEVGAKKGIAGDYGFLLLENAPGKKLGYAPFLRKPSGAFKNGDTFIAAGYSTDINNGQDLTADKTATKVTTQYDPKILNLKGDWFRGASGGPIFAKADNGVPYIAAIISQGTRNFNLETGKFTQRFYSESETKELGGTVTTESFAPQLRNFIRENSCPQQ